MLKVIMLSIAIVDDIIELITIVLSSSNRPGMHPAVVSAAAGSGDQ
jgi:Na+/H+ antiporter NhaA